MTKKQLVIALIFVVVAGAVAGVFVYLSHADSFGPAALPSSVESTSLNGMPQGLAHAVYGGRSVRKPEYLIEYERVEPALFDILQLFDADAQAAQRFFLSQQ